MTLEERIALLASAVGGDVGSLQAAVDSLYVDRMLPDGVHSSNMAPTTIVNAVSSLVSARLSLVRCPVKKGRQINGISFFSVGAAAVPLHQVFSLYNTDLTLIGTTQSDGVAGWAANTRKRLALINPYIPPADGWVYVGISVNATTVPTLGGISTALQITALAPIMHGHSNTGLAGPGSYPATANPLTPLAGVPTVMLD